MSQVAVLYCDSKGPYPHIAHKDKDTAGAFRFVDCWDITRDARKYDGPHPVICHPPCKHWGRLRHLASVRCASEIGDCTWSGRRCDLGGDWDGDFSRCPECASSAIDWNDRDCAPRAVEQVREHGGVLEHPAGSKLWAACHLPLPGNHGNDATHGYTIEIDQCSWGHVARKTTWLYLVDVPRTALEAPPFPGREPTHWVSGGRGREGKKAKTTPAPPGIKVCSAQQRRRTPPLLAEYLVRLARAASALRTSTPTPPATLRDAAGRERNG